MCHYISGFTKAHPLLWATGPTTSGKTVLFRLFCYLIYGEARIAKMTKAAIISESVLDPLIVLDNYESKELKHIQDLLLVAATGSQHVKRRMGTDSAVVREEVNSLIGLTSIDSIYTEELINRTLIVELDAKYMRDSFYESQIESDILKNRDVIISSILRIIADHVLVSVEEGI